MKGTLSFMHKEVKFEGRRPSGFMVELSLIS